jgi:hypothetical protein
MKYILKNKRLVIIILIILGLVLFLSFTKGNDDIWICENGQWVKYGNPTQDKPTVACYQIKENNVSSEKENISNNDLRSNGETCGENIGECGEGLKCAYPCGIQGCKNICMSVDELLRP